MALPDAVLTLPDLASAAAPAMAAGPAAFAGAEVWGATDTVGEFVGPC